MKKILSVFMVMIALGGAVPTRVVADEFDDYNRYIDNVLMFPKDCLEYALRQLYPDDYMEILMFLISEADDSYFERSGRDLCDLYLAALDASGVKKEKECSSFLRLVILRNNEMCVYRNKTLEQKKQMLLELSDYASFVWSYRLLIPKNSGLNDGAWDVITYMLLYVVNDFEGGEFAFSKQDIVDACKKEKPNWTEQQCQQLKHDVVNGYVRAIDNEIQGTGQL